MLKMIFNDITNKKNLVTYTTLLISFFLVMISLIGIKSISFFGVTTIELLPIILAVLIIISFDNIVQKHKLNDIQSDIGKLSTKIDKFDSDIFFIDLSNEQRESLRNRIKNASNIIVMGTNLGSTLELYYDIFEEKLENKEFSIKFIITDPNPNNQACLMTLKRKYRPISEDQWRNNITNTIEELQKLQKSTSGSIKIGVINHPLSYGGIIIDKDYKNGMIFLWYHSFKTKKQNRPKIILNPDKKYWYSFFLEEINQISNNCQLVV